MAPQLLVSTRMKTINTTDLVAVTGGFSMGSGMALAASPATIYRPSGDLARPGSWVNSFTGRRVNVFTGH